jgi:RHS repeat-associated protein
LVSETIYFYDGNRVIQERDGNGNPTVSYTRGRDLSGTLEGAGGIGGFLARSDGYSSGNWTDHNYYHADGNGNITYLVSSSQTLAASYRYDPYGNTISSSGTLAAANVYRFSSKECHVNSGMYYYLYRFYDPNLQRWINRDPLGDAGFELARHGGDTDFENSRTAYDFVGNDPVTSIDPLGLEYGTGAAAYQQCIKDCEGIRVPCKISAGLLALTIGALGPGPWKLLTGACGIAGNVSLSAVCDRAVEACKKACETKTKYTPPEKRPKSQPPKGPS